MNTRCWTLLGEGEARARFDRLSYSKRALLDAGPYYYYASGHRACCRCDPLIFVGDLHIIPKPSRQQGLGVGWPAGMLEDVAIESAVSESILDDLVSAFLLDGSCVPEQHRDPGPRARVRGGVGSGPGQRFNGAAGVPRRRSKQTKHRVGAEGDDEARAVALAVPSVWLGSSFSRDFRGEWRTPSSRLY